MKTIKKKKSKERISITCNWLLSSLSLLILVIKAHFEYVTDFHLSWIIDNELVMNQREAGSITPGQFNQSSSRHFEIIVDGNGSVRVRHGST